MVEQSYAAEPQGECAKDSAVTARDHSAFAIFTGLEHSEELFRVHAASKIVHFLLREATGAGIYEVLIKFAVGAV